jgi:hypothetical protein
MNHQGSDRWLKYSLERSQDLVAELQGHKRRLEAEVARLENLAYANEAKARHMDILFKAINENETVNNAWKNFAMVLRLAGYDK